MYKRNIFGRLAQSAAAVCAAVMTTVGYYSAALPDSYTCAYGSEITANTVLPITAQELAESRAAFKNVSAGGAGRSSKNVSLRLFGSVPIKDVKEETVDRPTLAAGGSAFGIRLVTDGVMIIDMKSVSGKCPAKDAGLKIGDVIEAVNGERVSTNDRVSEIIKCSGGKKCTVRYRRGGKEHEVSIKPVLSEGSYRAGMWVRDSSAGIGTMTFFDPETLAFAGLGHAICDSDTHEPLPLSEGSISDVKVNGCKKSEKGEPGQLVGEFTGGETGSLTAAAVRHRDRKAQRGLRRPRYGDTRDGRGADKQDWRHSSGHERLAYNTRRQAGGRGDARFHRRPRGRLWYFCRKNVRLCVRRR